MSKLSDHFQPQFHHRYNEVDNHTYTLGTYGAQEGGSKCTSTGKKHRRWTLKSENLKEIVFTSFLVFILLLQKDTWNASRWWWHMAWMWQPKILPVCGLSLLSQQTSIRVGITEVIILEKKHIESPPKSRQWHGFIICAFTSVFILYVFSQLETVCFLPSI